MPDAYRFPFFRKVGSVMMLIALLVASAGIVANAFSTLVQNENPDRALAINPLNLAARKALLLREFQTGDRHLTPEELAEWVSSSVALEGYEAQFLGFLGEIRSRQGNENQAQHLFEYSLELNPTEFWPLLRRMFYEISIGDNIRAFERAEVIYRRYWPYRGRATSLLPQILQDPAAFDFALQRLPTFPNGAGPVLSGLATRADGEDIAYRLAIKWHEQGLGEELTPTVNSVVGTLIRNGKIDRARELFQLTLDAESAKETGYVFNGRFRLPPGGSPFDWTLGDQKGVSMNRTTLNGGQHALAVRFLDTPVQFAKPLQSIFLPPGKFRLQVAYSSRELRAPKPVAIAVQCNGAKVASVELAPAEKVRVSSADFAIAEDCKRQTINIFNEKIVESWRNRYAGTLLIYEVSIEPLSS